MHIFSQQARTFYIILAFKGLVAVLGAQTSAATIWALNEYMRTALRFKVIVSSQYMHVDTRCSTGGSTFHCIRRLQRTYNTFHARRLNRGIDEYSVERTSTSLVNILHVHCTQATALSRHGVDPNPPDTHRPATLLYPFPFNAPLRTLPLQPTSEPRFLLSADFSSAPTYSTSLPTYYSSPCQ